MASVTVTLNGTQEVINGLDNMKARSKELRQEMAGLKNDMALSAAAGNGEQWSQQAARLSECEQAQRKLQAAIREGNKAVQDMNTLMQDLDKKTLKDLERDLKLARQKYRVIAPEDLNNLAKGKEVISQIQAAIAKRQSGGDLARTMADLKRELGDLKTAPIERLRDAQKRLTDAINTSKRGTAEYKAALEQLKGINKHIDAATKSFENQDSMIAKTMKRLASYVAVYMGFNQVLAKMKEFISGNLALSDSIADIQKVTKMTSEQVDALALSIDKIDSRSATESLYSLGYQAGMLGLKSTQDILGFITAADQMNWALKELGEDGAVQLMKVANLTHETDIYGVQEALNKVGSAINEITASSASSAAPIVDYVSRLGSVGATAGYASHELVAIGSTLDSLNVHAEMGSTAMTKFMLALKTNRVSIAESLGMSYKDLDQIEQTRGAVGLMVEVLERLKAKGADSGSSIEALIPDFKTLGSEGTRMIQTLTTMVDNVDTFKEHLQITSDAFEEGVSMLNEYNVKNETAAATFDRLGNMIREKFINSGFVRWLQDVGKWMLDVFKHTERHRVAWGALYAVMGSVFGVMVAMMKTGMVKFYQSLMGAIDSLKIAYQEQLAIMKAKKTAQTEDATATIASTEASVAHTVSMGTETAASFSLTAALKALWATMASNPLTAILAVLGAIIGAIYGLIEAVTSETEAEKDRNEALRDAEKWLMEERRALEEVHKKNVEARNDAEKRKKLIDEINEKYKAYLPKLLTEAADYNEIETALKGVNKQLSIKAALQMKEKLDKGTADRYADAVSDARNEAITDIDEIIEAVKDHIKKGKSAEGLRQALQARIVDLSKSAKNATAETLADNLEGVVKEYVSGANYVTLLLSGVEHQLLDLANDAVIPLTMAWSTYNKELKANESYVSAFLEENMTFAQALQLEAEQAANAAENERQLEAQRAEAEDKKRKLEEAEAKRIKDIVSQENFTLKQWYDNLEALGKYNSQNENFRKLFEDYFGPEQLNSVLDDTGKVVQKKAQAMISSTMESIKLELKDRGLTTELSHKSPGKDSHRDPSVQIKKDVQEAFNYLKAYYNEEEAKWLREREQHPDLVSMEVTDDRIRKTKESYQLAFQQLSQFLLKQNNDFMQNAPVLDYFGTKNMDVTKLRNRVQKDGQQIWDDITKNMTEAERKQLDSMVKHLNEMQKIIEKYDFVAQAEHSLQEGLVKNQLYYSQYYEAMKQLAEDGNNLTVSALQERYHINAAEAQALLVLLSDYHDQYLEAIRKQNERVTKLTKQGYKEQETEWKEHIELVEGWAKQMKTHEQAMDTDNKYSLELELQALQLKEAKQKEYIDILRQQLTEEWALRLGFSEQILEEAERIEERKAELRASALGGEDIESIIANDPEILASQARLQAMRDEIEARIELSAAYQEASQNLTAIQQDEADKQIEIEDRKKEAWKAYTDIIKDGAEDIGEAFFGEADDLREAGKNLLKELTKQTMQMVQQWIMRKIQKAAIRKAELLADKAADAAEIASDQAKNLAISTGNAASVLSKMTVKASETTAEAEAGISKGTSNAMSIGPWGAALVPIVISVITGALVAGISAIGKGKQEVTAETGVSEAEASSFAKKKVAAGMFTYAEGRYPVLGDDGNTYNARYENRVRTGLYSGPHFAIFGEKGREMVIDGQTTDKMLTIRPDLYQEILSLRDGTIRQRARAYADGLYPVFSGSPAATVSAPVPDAFASVLSNLALTTAALQRTLEAGIGATIVEDFSQDGPVSRMEENRKWMQEHGLLSL